MRILPASQDMTKIVAEFYKFEYNYLPLGMCASVDIFQGKVDEILGDIKEAKTHINDILVLSKKILSKNIDQLILIFSRLRAALLKVNEPKCSFELKFIP